MPFRFANWGRRAHKLAQMLDSPKLFALHRRGVDTLTYQKLERPWFREASIKTVIDVGANTGQFVHLIRAVLGDVQVYAFEPLPDCYDALVRATHGSNVQHFNVALGNSEGMVPFYRNRYAPSSSLRKMGELHREQFPFTNGENEIVQVPIKRLDGFQNEIDVRPNLLVKIDVQGYEDEVIRGGVAVISKASLMIVEVSFAELYHNAPTFESIHAMLRPLGFRFAGVLDQLIGPTNGAVLQADALFVKP